MLPAEGGAESAGKRSNGCMAWLPEMGQTVAAKQIKRKYSYIIALKLVKNAGNARTAAKVHKHNNRPDGAT